MELVNALRRGETFELSCGCQVYLIPVIILMAFALGRGLCLQCPRHHQVIPCDESVLDLTAELLEWIASQDERAHEFILN